MPSTICTAEPEIARPYDGAAAANGRAGGNTRRCVITRRSGPRSGMIRFAVAPDRILTPDLAEVLPGRGVWITASREALAATGLARAAARSLGRAAAVPVDLPAVVERLLARRCRDFLGLARRAGLAEGGFNKVRAAIASDAVSLMLTARDSTGRDGRELARRAAARRPDIRISAVLGSAELGAAFGRERQVHVVVADSPIADRLYRDLQRLSGLRDASGPDRTAGTKSASGADGQIMRETAQGR